MGKETVERRKALGLCVVCGNKNDRLPRFTCSVCVEKDRRRGREYYALNSDDVRTRTRAYYEEHREEHQKSVANWYAKHPYANRSYNLKTKLQALQIVSGQITPKCVYCPCDDLRFLEINHKNGGGAREASKYVTKEGRIGRAHSNFYWDIVKGRRSTDDLEVTCGPHNRWHYYKLKYGDDANRFKITWV